MSIQVIGAGFPRTGTKSLHAALETLGYGKCYHMVELFQDPQRIGFWEDARKDKEVDWNKTFEGYLSTVDFPGSMHYPKLLAYYPDAKVILTERNTDDWYQSIHDTVYRFNPGASIKLRLLSSMPFSQRSRYLFRVMKLIRSIKSWFFEGQLGNKAYAVKRFNEHLDEVKRITPKENLLIYNIKEGWEPLCDFLGVAVPDLPFPHANKREDFVEYVRGILNETMSK